MCKRLGPVRVRRSKYPLLVVVAVVEVSDRADLESSADVIIDVTDLVY